MLETCRDLQERRLREATQRATLLKEPVQVGHRRHCAYSILGCGGRALARPGNAGQSFQRRLLEDIA